MPGIDGARAKTALRTPAPDCLDAILPETLKERLTAQLPHLLVAGPTAEQSLATHLARERLEGHHSQLELLLALLKLRDDAFNLKAVHMKEDPSHGSADKDDICNVSRSAMPLSKKILAGWEKTRRKPLSRTWRKALSSGKVALADLS
eukprot:CAMPEP_0170573074 /NCGR_PEP_ID=MMETSP0224-20130122/2568_1 /TAXON_ID=285029 /ORGANISM="Togula jolla, Strain CCCM 725" /LENGTH=147 /DNA_ID=CAMNT_0010895631 /DNA_START=233 /DNA_END=674 /DNA_ORIENTATION=+